MYTTEIDFELPRGYLDGEGQIHSTGAMRLATAADEVLPLRDPRVLSNPAYLAIIVLSRVVVRLGTLPAINPRVIENLPAGDMAYLQDLYSRLNEYRPEPCEVTCPHCRATFEAAPRPEGFAAAPRS